MWLQYEAIENEGHEEVYCRVTTKQISVLFNPPIELQAILKLHQKPDFHTTRLNGFIVVIPIAVFTAMGGLSYLRCVDFILILFSYDIFQLELR